MNQGILVIFIVSLLFLATSVLAEKTVKTIEIPLGFVSQTVANQIYEKQFILSSPDGISEIISAEIYVKGDFQANTNVNAYVESQTCFPSSWNIPNQDVTNYQTVFDCSDLTKDRKSGTYVLKFLTDKVAQNLYAYGKFTYYNQPKGSIGIFGTEYAFDDVATIFLQLKDAQGFPVNNGDCLLDIYSPNQPNLTHPIIVLNAPMLYLNNSDGLYYYDMTVPNMTGVYMLSATCSYPFDLNWVYPPGGTESSNFTLVQGTYLGNTLSLNSKDDFLYMKCSSTLAGTKVCEAYYDFNCSCIANATSIELFYAGESSTTATMDFYVYNWTGSDWIQLPNSLVFSGGATSTAPIGINDFQSNIIPENDTIDGNGTMRIRLMTSSGSVFSLFDNWLNIRFSTTTGGIENLKGSGEMHLSSGWEEIIEWMFILSEEIGLTGFPQAYAGIGAGLFGDTFNYGIEYFCLDNETLERKYYYEHIFGTRERVIGKTQNITCDYGCEDDICKPSPLTAWFWVGILVMIVIALVWMVTNYASKK